MDDKKRSELLNKRQASKAAFSKQQLMESLAPFIHKLDDRSCRYELFFNSPLPEQEWFKKEIPVTSATYAQLDLSKMDDGRCSTWNPGPSLSESLTALVSERHLDLNSIVMLLELDFQVRLPLGDLLSAIQEYTDSTVFDDAIVVCPAGGWCLVINRVGELFFGRKRKT